MNQSDVAGLIALVLTGAQFVPQVTRLMLFEYRGGVSSIFWLLIGTQGLLWIVYALDQSLQYVALVNSIVLLASILILARLRAPSATVKASLAIGCIFGLAFIAVKYLVPAGAAGTVASILAVGAWLPQAWRASVDSDLRGLSPWSWLLTLASSSAWWIHGFFLHDTRVQVPASVSFLVSAWIVFCIFRQR